MIQFVVVDSTRGYVPSARADRGLVGGYLGHVMKKILLVVLVVLLVVIGIPVVMPGMGAAYCGDCDLAVAAGALCLLAVLGGLASVVLFASPQLVRARRKLGLGLLRAMVFYRPPRLA
jgi:membrane protease YdiL (CAAX protease family)